MKTIQLLCGILVALAIVGTWAIWVDSHYDAKRIPTNVPEIRFSIKRISDDPCIYLITDTKTGWEYIGASGIGITQLKMQ